MPLCTNGDERVVQRHHPMLAAAVDGHRQLRRLAFRNQIRPPRCVFSSTSRAATRPPPDLRSSTCATTPRSALRQPKLNLRPALRRRLIDDAITASVAVCAVSAPITRCPDCAASSASATIFGRAQIFDDEHVGVFAQRGARGGHQIAWSPRTSRWLTSDSRFSCTNLIWFSSVMT